MQKFGAVPFSGSHPPNGALGKQPPPLLASTSGSGGNSKPPLTIRGVPGGNAGGVPGGSGGTAGGAGGSAGGAGIVEVSTGDEVIENLHEEWTA